MCLMPARASDTSWVSQGGFLIVDDMYVIGQDSSKAPKTRLVKSSVARSRSLLVVIGWLSMFVSLGLLES